MDKVKYSLSGFGIKLWNEIPHYIRDLPRKNVLKTLHNLLLNILQNENDYIETPMIAKKMISS